jgi:hypothetical protein
MATSNRYEEGALEFEEFPGQAEIRVSKVLTTAGGDKIRAIVTTGNSVVLTAVGDPNGDTVIVTGELPTDEVIYKLTWGSVVKGLGEFIGGILGGDSGGSGGAGGGGQKCTTTTVTHFGKGGVIDSITTTTTCPVA